MLHFFETESFSELVTGWVAAYRVQLLPTERFAHDRYVSDFIPSFFLCWIIIPTYKIVSYASSLIPKEG